MSAIVLLAICVVVFMTIIIALVRNKKRLQIQLASYKTTVEYNAVSEPASVKVDTRKNVAYEPNAVNTKKNIAYEPNPAAVVTKKNIAYEPNPVAVDTKKNIAYEPNPAAVDTKKNIAYETETNRRAVDTS